MPAWVGDDGFPLSWRHYQYGLIHIRKSDARFELRVHNATAMAQAKSEDAQRYRMEVRAASGY